MVQYDTLLPTIGYYGTEVKVKSGVVGEFIAELRKAVELINAAQRSGRVQFYDFSCIPDKTYRRRSVADFARIGQRKNIYGKLGNYCIWMDFHVGIDSKVYTNWLPDRIGLRNSDVLNRPQSVRIYDGKWSQVAAFYSDLYGLKYVGGNQVYTEQKKDGFQDLSAKALPMLIKEAIRKVF